MNAADKFYYRYDESGHRAGFANQYAKTLNDLMTFAVQAQATIASLEDTVDGLKSRLRLLEPQGERPLFEIELSEMNSGGYYRLNERDFDALAKAGWVRESIPYLRRWRKTFFADDERQAEMLAANSFQTATGHPVDERGCDCCGRPFSIMRVYDD